MALLLGLANAAQQSDCVQRQKTFLPLPSGVYIFSASTGAMAYPRFILINDAKTWAEAQSYCRQHHTDLASVRNQDENREMVTLVPSRKTVWIGLFRDSWKWSDGSATSFQNWNERQPERSIQESCVASRAGKWENLSCASKLFFASHRGRIIRERLLETGVPQMEWPALSPDLNPIENLWDQLRMCALPSCCPRRYHFVAEKKSWAEAQSSCRQTYTDLATVASEEDEAELTDALGEHHGSQVWIGQYDDISSWRWSLQSETYYSEGETEFRMWASTEPHSIYTENCAFTKSDRSWADIDCMTALPFFCYHGKKKTTTVWVQGIQRVQDIT
uniref:C-type lectin domain-containing protein n=1 Tax=Myripristis murdjan TaxID=586833 RepID=A0A667WHX1_9TELE